MLYLFHGPETFLANLEIQKISQDYTFHKKLSVRNEAPVSFLYSLRNEVLQDSLLGESKLFVLQDFLSNVTPSLEEKWVFIFSQNKNSRGIIIWEKDKLPGKKSGLLKFLLKNAQVRQFQSLSLPQVKEWMLKRTAITPQAVNQLISLHGNNLWLLDSELLKLAAFANGQTVTATMVEKLCTSTLEENIFKLTDALGERKPYQALSLLNRLLANHVDAGYILSMLVRQLRLLALAQVGSLQKEHPFVQKKALSQSKNWQLSALQLAYQALTEIDYQIKLGADLETKLTLFLGRL